MIIKTSFFGDPNIGLYGYATDKYCMLGCNSKNNRKIKEALKVPVNVFRFMNTEFAGMFSAGNSHGIVASRVIGFDELKKTGVLHLDTKYTAIGNLVLMNDNGIILSPLLRRHKSEIEKFFGLPCEVTTVAGLRIVGSAGIATNKGCLLYPKTKEKEKEIIEKTLGVTSDIGTVNFGSYFVKSGIIANSHGAAVSDRSSGIEMGKISEALGFVR